jgi:heat shock protein HslJ
MVGSTLMPEEEWETNATEDENKPAEKPGIAFFALIALILFLALFVFFANVQGTRASAGVELTKHTWTLQSYADPAGVLVPALPGTNTTALFDRNNRLTGTGGCNAYSASYTTTDYGIVIASPIETEMFCSQSGIMLQEEAYLRNLPKANQFRFSEHGMNIYDSSGKPILVFASD